MKNKTKTLLIVGGLCFGLAFGIGSVFEQLGDLKDFILGLAAAFFVSALFIQTGKK